MKKIFAIIVGAGKGVRLGTQTPKQFLHLENGQRVFDISIDKFKSISGIEAVLAVVPDGAQKQFGYAIAGGDTRQESVFNGLKKIKQDYSPAPDDIILIHDAARPFIEITAIMDVIEKLQENPAVTLGVKVKDSLRHQDGHMIDRNGLYGLQTPQGFHFELIYKAHEQAQGKEGFTDDTSIVEALGQEITIVEGDAGNFKITTKEDLDMANAVIAKNSVFRSGQGYDVHAFDMDTPADSVRLCGVDVPYKYALKGHSDADVGLHAIMDAILGAIGKGDIGELFPPSDDRFKDMDSTRFVEKACALTQELSYALVNIDVTIICEAPKLGNHKQEMRTRIAKICELDERFVNVKATTTEKLGFTGRGEGIAAQAIVTVKGSH